QQLGALADGGWEIGSHTCSHPHLTEIHEAALEHELSASRLECERRLGRPCRTIAYPYGDYNERVAAAAGRAGYEAACTLPARLHAASPLEWPRVGVYHADDERRFRLKVSPTARRLRSSGASTAHAVRCSASDLVTPRPVSCPRRREHRSRGGLPRRSSPEAPS